MYHTISLSHTGTGYDVTQIPPNWQRTKSAVTMEDPTSVHNVYIDVSYNLVPVVRYAKLAVSIVFICGGVAGSQYSETSE